MWMEFLKAPYSEQLQWLFKGNCEIYEGSENKECIKVIGEAKVIFV